MEHRPLKFLILIVAYNAEKTLADVVRRIPQDLHRKGNRILIMDDSSSDQTFQVGLGLDPQISGMEFEVLRNPRNLGYGGNQKLGYRYAIESGFDVVTMVHGDAQYDPAHIGSLIAPIARGEADAVFGSRMMVRGWARQGGMPFYKRIGNRVLTSFQNWMLGTRLSEFHSGFRAYSIDALKSVPFESNSNGFPFDTEIIIQMALGGQRMVEVPIPTHYGNEKCHVNGLRYAWDIVCTTIHAKLFEWGIFYDRKFEMPHAEAASALKLGYSSSHQIACDWIESGDRILDLGCGSGELAQIAAAKGCTVAGVDVATEKRGLRGESFHILTADFDRGELPVDPSKFNKLLMLDVIEHLRRPEAFLETLRERCNGADPTLMITTANVAFAPVRLMLMLGRFNYGRRGILDMTHTRLYCRHSLAQILEQCGFRVERTKAIPAPFPKALGNTPPARLLLRLNEACIRVRPWLFAYQIAVWARPAPTVQALLSRARAHSCAERNALIAESTGRAPFAIDKSARNNIVRN